MPSPPTRAAAEAPTVVVFVRHGATPTTGKVLPGRARGLHLSDDGKAQAERTAAALTRALSEEPSPAGRRSPRASRSARAAERRVSAVYASPMERARETARPIASALGLRVTIERDLVECDFGEWTGKQLGALGKLPAWKKLMADPAMFRFPGGESIAELQARLLGFVQSVRARHPGELVVAVSHADPIRIALTDALGAHLSAMHRLAVGTASMSVVSYGSRGASVLTVNALGDIPPLGGA